MVNEVYDIGSLTHRQEHQLARERVLRGAEALDEYNEIEWRKAIQSKGEMFDISDGRYCVFGIRFGDYYDGITKLEFCMPGTPFEQVSAVELGLEADTLVSWETLQGAWCSYLGIEFDPDAINIEQYGYLQNQTNESWIEERLNTLRQLGELPVIEEPKEPAEIDE